MSQPLAATQVSSNMLQQVQQENAELQRYVAAQKAVITSLERRVGRSLEALGVHLQPLTLSQSDNAVWNCHLTAVQNEVDRLSDLISDTMLLQKLEAGKVEIKRERLEVSALLTAVSRHLLEPKDDRPVRLVCEIERSLPEALADQELTEAVLTDLLARALKYSDSGSPVVLGAEAVADWIHFRVTAQRFAPAGNRDFATEIVLCCRRIEVQMGEVTCQHHPDGRQTVTIALPLADTASPN